MVFISEGALSDNLQISEVPDLWSYLLMSSFTDEGLEAKSLRSRDVLWVKPIERILYILLGRLYPFDPTQFKEENHSA